MKFVPWKKKRTNYIKNKLNIMLCFSLVYKLRDCLNLRTYDRSSEIWITENDNPQWRTYTSTSSEGNYLVIYIFSKNTWSRSAFYPIFIDVFIAVNIPCFILFSYFKLYHYKNQYLNQYLPVKRHSLIQYCKYLQKSNIFV